jgi:rhodanese-related sulfurtransferase
MSYKKKTVELLVNCSIGLLLAYLGVVALDKFIRNKESPDSARIANQVSRGKDLSQVGIDWTKVNETLVLALSPGCEYCFQNAAFYQKLSSQLLERSDMRLVVVLRKSDTTSSSQYLEGLGVVPDEIREMPLRSLGVEFTPTIFLANRRGVVEDVWTGKLSDQGQEEIFRRLELKKDTIDSEIIRSALQSSAGVFVVTPADLAAQVEEGIAIVVLDIRDRVEYSKNHLKGAKNIPLDELPARATDELPRNAQIVLSCNCSEDDMSRLAAHVLMEKGFRNVAILKGATVDLSATRQAGVERKAPH